MRRARDGQLTEKDMSVLREGDRAWEQHKSQRAVVRDYSLQHRVELCWDLNDEAKQERMFKLRVGENEVILDGEEFLRILRWV